MITYRNVIDSVCRNCQPVVQLAFGAIAVQRMNPITMILGQDQLISRKCWCATTASNGYNDIVLRHTNHVQCAAQLVGQLDNIFTACIENSQPIAIFLNNYPVPQCFCLAHSLTVCLW